MVIGPGGSNIRRICQEAEVSARLSIVSRCVLFAIENISLLQEQIAYATGVAKAHLRIDVVSSWCFDADDYRSNQVSSSSSSFSSSSSWWAIELAAFVACCVNFLINAGNARQNDLGIIPIAAVETKSIIGTVGSTWVSGSTMRMGSRRAQGSNPLELAFRSRIDTALRFLCIYK